MACSVLVLSQAFGARCWHTHNSKRESCKVEFRHYNHAFASLAFCSPTLRLGLPTLPGGLSSLATDSQYLPDTMLELPRDNLLRH